MTTGIFLKKHLKLKENRYMISDLSQMYVRLSKLRVLVKWMVLQFNYRGNLLCSSKRWCLESFRFGRNSKLSTYCILNTHCGSYFLFLIRPFFFLVILSSLIVPFVFQFIKSLCQNNYSVNTFQSCWYVKHTMEHIMFIHWDKNYNQI